MHGEPAQKSPSKSFKKEDLQKAWADANLFNTDNLLICVFYYCMFLLCVWACPLISYSSQLNINSKDIFV